MLKQVKYLLIKEFLLEWRNKYTLGGLLLYIVSTVFVCMLSFITIENPLVWSALFWIIILFAALNAISKSFTTEKEGRQLYYYTLASAQSVIISKIIYNIALMIVVAVVALLVYSLLLNNPVSNNLLFALTVISGSGGIAIVLTTISAIASKTQNNFTLMAILSFPLLLPLILLCVKLTKYSISGIDWSVAIKYLAALEFLNLLTVLLSYILFPYLWRD